ncbi:MAG: DUF6443 domain-containing protein, partial [Chitinophagaceae bacterium]
MKLSQHQFLRNFSLALLFVAGLQMTAMTQVVPTGGGVPGVNNVPPLEPANLGGKINYVRTWQPWKPIADATQVPLQTIADVKVVTAYVDGQGRVMQTVSKQTSPAGKDLVNYKQFDKYGRETIQPLPYTSVATDGEFKTNPYTEQQYYYSTGAVNNNQYAGEQIYFGRTAFEASPLGRPDSVMAPGNSWAGSNRGIRYQYLLNTTADSVRLWTVADASNSTPLTTTLYGEGQLSKTVVIDEQGNQSAEYKDKEGKVILKKVQLDAAPGAGHSGWLCTYYIYDDYGLLRYVVQPEGVKTLNTAGWTLTTTLLNEQCFRYEYDQRDRMIIKKVPGAGEVWMVYDARDRMVLTQDAKMRTGTTPQWLYTMYDGANRPIATGKLNSTADRATHQAAAWYSTSYPNLTNFTYEELSSTVYDFAEFPVFDAQDVNKLDAGTNLWPEAVVNSPLVYGKPLVTTTKTDGFAQATITNTFYDEKGRVIQTSSVDGRKRVNTITSRYDFSGKIIASYHRHHIPDHVQGGNLTITQLTKMQYDAAGRLLKVWKKINDGATDKLIVENSYDELSQQKSRKLAPEYNGNAGIETLNYEYNIRGWLKGVNKDYTTGTANNHWFGQTLSYDHGFSTQLYNGNISGLQWRSKGDGEQRAFGFMYDKVNRLQSADFTQYTGSQWSTSAGLDFTANNLGYDANGNILTMNQKGWKLGGSSLIDQLSYTYETGSNKLKQVLDGVNNNASMLGDFKYDAATKTATDYLYDINGNLVKDNNKNIKDDNYDGIEYNHLNLPVKIRVKNKGTIEYRYDAAGNKMQKITTEGTQKTVTNYDGGFVYQFRTTGNVDDGIDTLQFFSHEEGRVRPSSLPSGGLGWAYDYILKDHLGNIRMVLTEDTQTDMYPAATMETAAAATEETYYSNLPSTRSDLPAAYPPNSPPGNAKVAKVSGNESGFNNFKIGPAIVLKVMSGDSFNVTVNSWWENVARPGTPNNPFNELLWALSGSVAAAAGGHGNATQFYNSSELNGAVSGFLGSQTYNTSRPKAFLNWLLLDEQFKYVQSGSGFDQVGAQDGIKTHTFTGLPVTKSGYLYIFVSNSTSNIDVFFDNLQVTHVRGPLLEENSYYPFGLTQAGISSKALSFGEPKNKEKTFQGQRFDDDLGINWIQFKWRNHDPQIGRFVEIDPLSEKYVYNSTYAFSENKVIVHVELEGLESWFINTDGMTPAERCKYMEDFHAGMRQSAKGGLAILGSAVLIGASMVIPGFAPVASAAILSYMSGAPVTPTNAMFSSASIAASETSTVGASTAAQARNSTAVASVNASEGQLPQVVVNNQVGKAGEKIVTTSLQNEFPDAIVLNQVSGKFADGTKTVFDNVVVNQKTNSILLVNETKTGAGRYTNQQLRFWQNGESVTLAGKKAGSVAGQTISAVGG